VFTSDPKGIIKQSISDWARSALGLRGDLGKRGFEIKQVDAADHLSVHVVVSYNGRPDRVFKITVSEVAK
jgi:hypothetical protein